LEPLEHKIIPKGYSELILWERRVANWFGQARDIMRQKPDYFIWLIGLGSSISKATVNWKRVGFFKSGSLHWVWSILPNASCSGNARDDGVRDLARRYARKRWSANLEGGYQPSYLYPASLYSITRDYWDFQRRPCYLWTRLVGRAVGKIFLPRPDTRRG